MFFQGSCKWKWLKRVAQGKKRKRVEDEVKGEGEEGDIGNQEEGTVLPDVPRPILWGRRSHLDATAWKCSCGVENQPSRHLLVDLPAFKCECGGKKRVDFRFSFGNLAANGVCPVGEILDQGCKDECMIYALTKATEITARMCNILRGSNDVIPTLDPDSLKAIYVSSRADDEIPEEKIDFQDDAALKKMMELMQNIGVQDMKREQNFRIGGVEQIGGDFEGIVKELANGYPLIVDIMTGMSFSDLQYGEVYRCPFNNTTLPKRRRRRRIMLHTVILVGAARLGKYDYYYVVNSYGDGWCKRFQKETEHVIGGVGKLIAEDIFDQPYKFLRCVQNRDQTANQNQMQGGFGILEDVSQ